jgi:hypothetical protein
MGHVIKPPQVSVLAGLMILSAIVESTGCRHILRMRTIAVVVLVKIYPVFVSVDTVRITMMASSFASQLLATRSWGQSHHSNAPRT